MPRRILLTVSVLGFLTVHLMAADDAPESEVDGNRAKQYVAHLSTDALQGRMTCTPGYRQAAEWVAGRFKQWGLQPAGEDGTYYQKVTIRAFETKEGVPELAVGGRRFAYDDEDFSIDDLSTPGVTVRGEVVFVGYGISAPKKGLDEYHELNVKGKIVLVLTGSPTAAPEPRRMFQRSPSSSDEDKEKKAKDVWQVESLRAAKIKTAYDHGAAGILLYDPDEAESGSSSSRRRYSRRRTKGAVEPDRDFLCYTINERIFRAIARQNDQESRRGLTRRLSTMRQAIKEKHVASYSTGVAVTLKGFTKVTPYDEEHGNNVARNVLAKIEGTDPKLKGQYVIVGAHLDHVGTRAGYVYNGADDNASGSAVVMEVARALAAGKWKPRRTVIFCCWCGEELGLIGSIHYSGDPCDGVTMDNVVTYFNLDMVGMGATLGAPGALNFPTIWQVIQRGQDPGVMKRIEPSTGGTGGSDHTGFIRQGIEAIALMSRGGVGHQDYHRPEDDIEKIEPQMLELAGQFVKTGVMNLADETKTSLLVARRLERYRALRTTIRNYNPELPDSAWQRVPVTAKTVQAADGELDGQLFAALRKVKAAGSSGSSSAERTEILPRKSLARGLAGLTPLDEDERLLDQVVEWHGIGRVDIAGDDPVWVKAGRLTDRGKSALGKVEARSLVLRLHSPGAELMDDVLAATTKPFIITGQYEIPEPAVSKLNARGVQFGVDLDPKQVGAFLERVESLRVTLGERRNLFAYLTGKEITDSARVSLYMGLIDRGWTRNEISGGKDHDGVLGGALLRSLGK